MGSKTYSILDNNATKAWYDNFTKGSFLANPTTQDNYYNTIGYAPMGEVGLSAPAQTTSETTPSDITNVDTATTNDSDMPNITSNADVQALVSQNNALNYANYVSAVNEGRKAYQELFKESLKRKQALADKKVRSDRSTALANALGSLVNVFTAYGMAKKGDYAPIVAEYDSTPDSELKKSIAARYALENENEGLLMQLVKDRINSEAEIAKGKYERDVKANEAMAKAKAADTKNSLDWWKWQKGEEGKDRRFAKSEDNKTTRQEKALEGAMNRAEVIATRKPKSDSEKNSTKKAAAFIQAVNDGKKIPRREGSNRTDPFEMNANPGVKLNFEKIYNGLSGLSEEERDYATTFIHDWWLNQTTTEEILKEGTVSYLIEKAKEYAKEQSKR